MSLAIGRAEAFAAQLLSEDVVLVPEMVDDLRVHSAGSGAPGRPPKLCAVNGRRPAEQGVPHELKAVFLGAVFLIDFAHFEDDG